MTLDGGGWPPHLNQQARSPGAPVAGGRPMSEINMTPLIDVMLVLLVIFIGHRAAHDDQPQLDLPKPKAPARATRRPSWRWPSARRRAT